MPSERLQTAFFYTNFTVPHPSRYTVILKPAIPAQAGIRVCRVSVSPIDSRCVGVSRFPLSWE
ncbi:TPA: hypothetical protein ACFK6Y_09155 [Neisseria gonorrhoeae]|nr:hypothetical protein EGH13_08840 [Neisseria gonorrhoeae]PAX23235.1 hypothetical protein CKX34_12055 [Neisseria gonorrhoeae]TJW36421.1 hypothetical protein E8M73_09400 [Neisseria gonorrhoeae]TJW93148.1 hypothetical protein E8M69_09365 [Neisseria gonorrhoeae]TJX10748.1 hypothetical protein E8M59_09260 [Neisseria gonorrhoeae]